MQANAFRELHAKAFFPIEMQAKELLGAFNIT